MTFTAAKAKETAKRFGALLICLSLAAVMLSSCEPFAETDFTYSTDSALSAEEVKSEKYPLPDSGAYSVVNDNVPYFSESDLTTEPFEIYSPLDELGRCGAAYANICREIMPDGERGKIGSVKPTGWHTVKYNGVVEGNYLYNRCHLIGYQLAGENANELNLITGTRYLNTAGMLPFENMVADYVRETDNHVLYRVTPRFDNDDLLAQGVLMEALSVEDGGELEFCVFCPNEQPGITIDYKTGESKLYDGTPIETEQPAEQEPAEVRDYVLNKSSKKFHLPECDSVGDMKPKNKKNFRGTREELIEKGYTPCKSCKP